LEEKCTRGRRRRRERDDDAEVDRAPPPPPPPRVSLRAELNMRGGACGGAAGACAAGACTGVAAGLGMERRSMEAVRTLAAGAAADVVGAAWCKGARDGGVPEGADIMKRKAAARAPASSRYYPGDDDVRGAAPRPRYSQFGNLGGPLFVAYFDPDDARTGGDELSRDDTLLAIYGHGDIDTYASLLGKRPHYEFRTARADHYLRQSAPLAGARDGEVVGAQLLMWFKRPIAVLRRTGDAASFPWPLDAPMRFFGARTREYIFDGTLERYDLQPGAATGYAFVRITAVPSDEARFILSAALPAS
jgi:hypothetical protein